MTVIHASIIRRPKFLLIKEKEHIKSHMKSSRIDMKDIVRPPIIHKNGRVEREFHKRIIVSGRVEFIRLVGAIRE